MARSDVEIVWAESGGPKITRVPEATGFGSQLTAIGIERQLGGTIRRDWQPDGLRIEMSVSLERLSPRGG